MQGGYISASVTALIVRACPHLAVLQLDGCGLDTAALLTALRSWQHLSSLALSRPCHRSPGSLRAAALEGVDKRAMSEVIQDAADGLAKWPEHEEARSLARAGVLLSRLPSLTSVKLNMAWAPAALKMLLLGPGVGSRLQDLSIGDPKVARWRKETMQDMLLPALQACSNLRSLELLFKLPEGALPALSQCPSLQGLRSLKVPRHMVEQEELAAILQGMPGEGSG